MDKQEWNGEGLPPVGTVCEAIFNEASKTYYKTKVFGVNEHGQPIHRWEEGSKKFEYQASPLKSVIGSPVFRPIRTPEQIEAERRERIKKQMFDVWSQAENITASDSFYSVYDAILAGKIEGVKIDEHP
ncbi:hypothetical protein AV650_15430 [Serratia fonticola]|nr:hypothetical protein AV650_15430 [Serratia fonticola]